jgi:hypothetical protein
MSGEAVDACGNCGAPLEPTEDGRCRWCRVKVPAGHPHGQRADRARPGISWRWNWRLAAIGAIAVALAAGVGVGISSSIGSHQAGPPQASSTSDSGVVAAVPPVSTDLQALRQDFGPWQELTGQPTGRPALLLLESGSTYASQRWTVPSSATWWTQDLGGNVTSVEATSGRAAITDADGTGYTVGIDQAFIISSNPDTVLLIRPGGTVMSMSLAQATAVRQPLGK